MRYRTLGRTGFQVSEIGLGGEYLEGQPLKQVCDTVDAAMDAGINLLDCFMSNPEIRSDLGTALKGKRDKMYIQGHFRSIWKNGQYGRTMDVKVVREFFEDLLRRMQTDSSAATQAILTGRSCFRESIQVFLCRISGAGILWRCRTAVYTRGLEVRAGIK